jgi:oxygen-independent coproporphyrinogen-3 oxidase
MTGIFERMVRHLYVHTPFCAKVCPYCAFHVHLGGAAAQREFVTALRMEWQRAREEFPLALETVYFGGGTPSILSAELFAELAEELGFSSQPDCHPERSEAKSKDQFSFFDKRQTKLIPRQARDDKPKENREFTLEVNPATVTPKKAAAWRAAGVNRISLGAQSFDAEMLRLLGRQHAPEEIAETCALLREHGFTNINIDLMFALPGQSEAKWMATLEAALACEPNHISAYALTYEEDTPFFEKLQRGDWRQDEESEIAMFTQTREALGAAGLVDYEISNFARPGFESRHNLAYWRGADYLGLGPSACSTIGAMRWRNAPDTKAYAKRIAQGEPIREERETLDTATRARERIMFGLRMREGVALEEFGHATSRLKELETNGLAFEEEGRVRLTSRGQLVADSIAGMFV